MSKTLQQILGGKNLTGVIQGVKPGVPKDLFPPAFVTPTRTVEGDHCTYRKVSGTRKTARLVQYGSPSVARNLSGVSELPVKLMHSKEHITHAPAVLMNLTNLGDENKQKLGQGEITRQTAEFKDLFTNLRYSVVYSILRYGAVYFDGNGNLLPSSTGAVTTIDFGMSANNKNQLNGIISASWATAGTSIHAQIAALKKAARKATGYPITHCFYGSNILDDFLTNTKLKELINRTSVLQSGFAAGEIPNGFLGLQWHPMSEAFFNDNSGTDQDWFSSDICVFTPDPSPEWWEVIEGTYPIPTDIGKISADGAGALGQVTEAAGMFSYAQLLTDPVTIKQIAGDTFIICLKVPNAIYIADVEF